MKIRLGFVSNSSSSSFIVAIRNNPNVYCGTNFDLIEIIESLDRGGETSIITTGLKNIIDQLEKSYKDYKCEADKETIETLKQKWSKKRGWDFAYFSVSNRDTIIHKMMELMEQEKDLVIINKNT